MRRGWTECIEDVLNVQNLSEASFKMPVMNELNVQNVSKASFKMPVMNELNERATSMEKARQVVNEKKQESFQVGWISSGVLQEM